MQDGASGKLIDQLNKRIDDLEEKHAELRDIVMELRVILTTINTILGKIADKGMYIILLVIVAVVLGKDAFFEMLKIMFGAS